MTEILPLWSGFLLAQLCLLGAVFGSFGNVLVWRLPRGQSILGRSRCPKCGRTLSGTDLVPLLSYAWLRGRCRTCRERIGARYPLLELGGGMLFLGAGLLAPTFVGALLLGLGLLTLLIVAVIDIETQTIPDALSIAIVIIALAFQLAGGHLVIGGALLGLMIFGGQWLLSRGRWLGSGDIFVAVGIGLLVGGTRAMALAVLAAYIIGALVAVIGLATGTLKRHDRLPFEPFLATGALVALLLSPTLVPWLMSRGW